MFEPRRLFNLRPIGISFDPFVGVRFALGALLLFAFILPNASRASSQAVGAYYYQVQSISAADLGISHPAGLAFSPGAGLFYVLEKQPVEGLAKGSTRIVKLSPSGKPEGTQQLAVTIPDPLNAAFAESTNSLYFLDRAQREAFQVQGDPAGNMAGFKNAATRVAGWPAGLTDPQGMAYDAQRERLHILDAAGPALIEIALDSIGGARGPASKPAVIKRTAISALAGMKLRGLAYNPANRHAYVLGLEKFTLYEVDEQGQVLSFRDLSDVKLIDPQGMVFAPSADSTDDPAILDLFIADAGGQIQTVAPGRILELSFREPITLSGAASLPVAVAHVIDTSKAAWNPSSPDPAGIAFVPATGTLLISDSEVDEGHPDWQGVNVFGSTTDGTLLSTCDTLAFSKEPAGVAMNPDNGHIFFSDDSKVKIFEVDPVDGIYCNDNDTVASLDLTVFGSSDPEGVAYGDNKLFVSDGLDAEVFVIDLGPDGVIGGGNERVASNFDTYNLGLRDPEGIEYNPDNGTLFVVSTAYDDFYLLETTVTGTIINKYDLTFMGRIRRSGLAYGTSSQDPAFKSIYLASRGVDNGTDPSENDGKVYELLRLPPPETIYLPMISGK